MQRLCKESRKNTRSVEWRTRIESKTHNRELKTTPVSICEYSIWLWCSRCLQSK